MTLIERNILTPPQGEGGTPPSVAHVLSSALKAVRRHLWLLSAIVAACLLLSVISIVSMTPVYKATTTIYIDPRESRGFQEAGGILLSSDALVVDSEVKILMSHALAERVVDKLGLAARDLESGEKPASPNLTARLKSLLVSGGDEDQTGILSPEEAAKRRAVSKLRRSVEIGRLGNTYVIEITAKHADKQKVAAIANAYAEEYLTSGLEVQAERLAQVNNWSSEALREAVEDLDLAEQEVNQFRLVNQIDSGDRQVVGAELSQLNSALVSLRNERFDKELLLERVRKVLSDGSTATDVTDIGVPGIDQIRAEILRAEIEVARMAVNGTRSSLQANIVASELDAMKLQLDLQYQRVARELENQIEFSLAEEKRLSDRGEELRADVATVSEKEAKLRELEIRANSARALYQALLMRFHETSDDFAYNTSSARVLTAAQVPAGPSAPRTSKILVLGLVAGVFLAMVAIFLMEQLDNRIRQPRQIEALGLRYLGAIPRMSGGKLPFGFSLLRSRRDVNAPALSGGKRARDLAQLTYAVDFPLSEFSETIRSIVFDAVASNPTVEKAQIIAVTSSSPRQGKSTLAANLAAYYAKQGKRTHLIDFDLRNPDLSQVFASRGEEVNDAAVGDADAQTGKPVTDFVFSGRVEDTNAADVIELINPATIVKYLESLKAECDVVVLDIGSLCESPDARMCAELADYVVLAVRWGFNQVEQFELSLARGLNRTGKSVGAVLTMVPPSAELEETIARDGSSRPQAAA
ncbi:MAG: exopolysaccharide transport family protein [Dinoroseobacter sp.]|nr:exopolysaccharide transport family protein [Dinoroseobacter sp.]